MTGRNIKFRDEGGQQYLEGAAGSGWRGRKTVVGEGGPADGKDGSGWAGKVGWRDR